MPSPAEKWESTKEVIEKVPEVPEIEAVPLGGEGNDVVVDLSAEREKREGIKAASEAAKRDTETSLKKTRERLQSREIVEPLRARKQPFPEAPSEPMIEPAGKMRSRTWADNESRGFFARLFKRKD
jgi:hypothetical protein